MTFAGTDAWMRKLGRIEPDYVAAAFAEQRGFVTDPSKNVGACCGRRSGKSVGLAARLLRASEKHPGEMSLYIAQTKNNARMIVGRALMTMSRLHGLNLVMKEVDQRLNVIHPNGAHMWLAGAKHREAFEDFRGHKFSEIQVDEAQFHGMYLQEAVEEVLEPALGDLDGAMVVSGTPSPLPIGFFHAVTTGMDNDGFGRPIPQWSHHHWTMAENTFFRRGEGDKYREEIRVKRGWHAEHPTFLREYMGLWVHDPASLVYPFSHALNGWDGVMPAGRAVHTIGLDLGSSMVERSTAFAVLSTVPGQPEVYLRECYKRAGLTPARIAAELERLRGEYPTATIVVDTGGLGGGYLEQFNDWGIPCEPARKADKVGRMELLRGALEAGTFRVHGTRCRDFVDEVSVLQWNEERTDVDDRFADHACDAVVYAHGAVSAVYRPEQTGPEVGSPEWTNAQVSGEKAKRAKEIQRGTKGGKRAFK